jgi:hypothetical protein
LWENGWNTTIKHTIRLLDITVTAGPGVMNVYAGAYFEYKSVQFQALLYGIGIIALGITLLVFSELAALLGFVGVLGEILLGKAPLPN